MFNMHVCVSFAELEPVSGPRLDVGFTKAHSEEGRGDQGRGLLPDPVTAAREAGQVSGDLQGSLAGPGTSPLSLSLPAWSGDGAGQPGSDATSQDAAHRLRRTPSPCPWQVRAAHVLHSRVQYVHARHQRVLDQQPADGQAGAG